MLSLFPSTRATSPAATRTTPLRWRLAAKEQAVPEHARLSMPRFVHPGVVRTTLKAVRSSSEVKTPRMNKVEGQMPLCQEVILDGASAMGAE